MGLKDVPFGSLEKFNVIVEIPQGSQDKYEYDKDIDLIKLDRVLFTAQRYPANYGFVPQTLAEDGDCADVLLFSTNPFFPGAVVEARALGYMNMVDTGESDNKILCVPTKDVRFKDVQSLADLPEHSFKEIKNFFETYKLLQDAVVTVGEFEPKEKAFEYLEKTVKAFQEK